jgi:ABC-type transporter Mla MlaB component
MSNLISLPAELTIYTVSELHPQWLARLNEADRSDAAQDPSDDTCRVDAAAVEEVDAAGLQLLLSLSNALARRERALQLVSPSPPLARACAALGVSSLLANADLTGVAP